MVLSYLSMQSGYTLDYIYRGNGDRAEPTLYARKIDSQPLISLPPDNSPQTILDSFKYWNYVVSDDTEETYFQFIALRIQGGQL